MNFTPCPYCEQPFGEVTDNSPKLITFENQSYQLGIHRTWAGMNWGEPTGYELRHWCPWGNGSLVRVIGRTMTELKQNWEDLVDD